MWVLNYPIILDAFSLQIYKLKQRKLDCFLSSLYYFLNYCSFCTLEISIHLYILPSESRAFQNKLNSLHSIWSLLHWGWFIAIKNLIHTLSNLNQDLQNPKTHVFILLCIEAHKTNLLNVIIELKYHLESGKLFYLQN